MLKKFTLIMTNRVKMVSQEQVEKEEEMEIQLKDMNIVKIVGLKNMIFIMALTLSIEVWEKVARKGIKEMVFLLKKLHNKLLKIFKS
jgi:hypothetical protein